MNKAIAFFSLILLWGCGYTTYLANYDTDRIYIEPVVNNVQITQEMRKYSSYKSYPLLLEKKMTNKIIDKFNSESKFKVVKIAQNSLRLVCSIEDYRKETINYGENDAVQQQRLRLYVKVNLYGNDDKIIDSKEIVGETTYYLTGPYRKSIALAEEDLVDDTARRILEFVTERWD